MINQHLLCIGYGYTARAIARQLDRAQWMVSGTTRDTSRIDRIRQDSVNPVLWPDEITAAAASASHLLISVPPAREGGDTMLACPALEMLGPILADSAGSASKTGGRWCGYLSSNGVYGDHGGDWVDEATPPRPTTTRGQRRLAAETAWRDFGQTEAGVSVTVLRLPGIYGPGRSALDSVRAGTAKRIVKPGQVFSRMHVDDIACAVIAAMKVRPDDALFNLCDDEPAPPEDVVGFACDLLGVAPPAPVALEDADLSPMGRSFYADNKRVRNQRMKEDLCATLRYRSYREGLRAILAGEQAAQVHRAPSG